MASELSSGQARGQRLAMSPCSCFICISKCHLPSPCCWLLLHMFNWHSMKINGSCLFQLQVVLMGVSGFRVFFALWAFPLFPISRIVPSNLMSSPLRPTGWNTGNSLTRTSAAPHGNVSWQSVTGLVLSWEQNVVSWFGPGTPLV